MSTFGLKNRSLRATLLLFLLACSHVSMGQQEPLFTQFLTALPVLQPAYAVVPGCMSVSALSRAQWIGWPGAPGTSLLTMQGPFRSYNAAMGLTMVCDKWGPITQYGLWANYAYRIRLREGQYLAFGIRGGCNGWQAALSNLQVSDPDDPAFERDVGFRLAPVAGCGIFWYDNRFFLGAASPTLIPVTLQNSTGAIVFRENIHLSVMAGWLFGYSKPVKMKATLLWRRQSGMFSYLDAGVQLLLLERLWVGGLYRLGNAWALTTQVILNGQLKFGYSYDLTTVHNKLVNTGTHEFSIQYDFKLPRRFLHQPVNYF